MKLPFEQDCLHEEKLRDYFEQFDFPAAIEPLARPVCIMLFTNRSGSSMISEYMRATDRFVGFGEPLNQRVAIERAGRDGQKTFAEYMRHELDFHLALKRDPIFGMKASYGQALMLMHCGAIPSYFDDVRWVVIKREDLLSQAISFSIAHQTKQWRSFDSDEQREPEYDYQDIRNRLRGISQSYMAIDTLCAAFDLRPYRINHEEFASDPVAGTRKLAAYLGVDEVEIDTGRLRMRRLRNELTEQFRARFVEDCKSSLR